MALNKVLKVNSSSELLSFILNVTPELKSEIDLPVQGESIAKYGQLIMSNQRFKNAFLNTINLIGLTVINRNYWENPWEVFANRGTLNFGQTVREMLVDIADVYDYQEFKDNATHFLENVVPNVFNYLHEINFQKFYKTTTSDAEMAMAFQTENGLFDLVEKISSSLYEGLKYDKYIMDKYQLCRRILAGTVSVHKIENYDNLTPRERVAKMKAVSNKMTFRSPNYNPAGARKATLFENQILMMNTDFEADMSTDVLATSFFRDEAEMKTRGALIDGFGNHDEERLAMLIKDYVPFTEAELQALSEIPAMLLEDTFFQDYYYALNTEAEGNGTTKRTDFYNPETLKHNMWLHAWLVLSTSPFANAVVFTKDTPEVTEIVINPQESSVSAGLDIQLTASVTTKGFANKAVTWSIFSATGQETPVTVDLTGKVHIPADFDTSAGEAPQITVKATSVYNPEVSSYADITVL